MVMRQFAHAHLLRLDDPASPQPDPPARPSPRPLTERDRGIDTWRAAAVLRVVTYHTLGWAWLTIAFPAIGLMFALAGSLMARSLDRRGTRAVASRLRRLLPPLWLFGACAVAVMLTAGWRERPATALGWWELLWWILPVRTPPAGGPQWAWVFTAMLWYVVAYLWFVGLSPALLVVFRRWPWPVLGLSLLVPVAMHFQPFTVGRYLVEPLTNVCTFASCWLLGFAHHDRLLHRVPFTRFAIAVAVLAAASAAWLLHIGSQQHDFDINHVPLANGLWPVAIVAVVLRFDLPIGALARVRWLQRLVAVLNARAVTIYLWHFAMVVASGCLLGAPQRPYSPLESTALLATVWGLTAMATILTGWIEDLAAHRPLRLIPPGRSPLHNQPRPRGSLHRDTSVNSAPATALPAGRPRTSHAPATEW